jgi:uncharacterized protein (TIGR02145 family)
VPDDSDFALLSYYFGGTTASGGSLKETGSTHWKSPNSDATNESNFTGLPGGQRDGNFERLELYAFFWNKNDYKGNACGQCANECSLFYCAGYLNQDWGEKNRGMSIPCIKDK